MPVSRYRDVSEMPPLPRLQGDALVEALDALWERFESVGAPACPRGVQRFRSIEEAQEARLAFTRAHVRELRERRRRRATGDDCAG